MEHKLLILSKDFSAYQKIIKQADLPGLVIYASDDIVTAIRVGGEYDLVFGEPSLVSKVINHLPKVEWVQSTWAGVEPLIKPDLRQDYVLTNARHVYGGLMSEYVFGYLLLIERKILETIHLQKQRIWDNPKPGTLKGKILGILGVGSIGAHLAHTAHQFGMKVYGFTQRSETCPDVDRYFHQANLSDFLTSLDYLVCCLPGTAKTKHMLDASFIANLPSKTWLINIGRGNTIDELALVAALTQRKLAGAILDVFEEEPLPANHPLWSTPNTHITFHTAAKNYPPDIAKLFIQNYHRLIDRLPLLNVVDFEAGY